MKSSFFIVADRGNLKAFRLEKVPADRPARLHAVESLSFEDGHAKVGQVNTDSAGRFGNSTSDRHYEIESDKRAAKTIAGKVESILEHERPAAWAFAAPGEIKEAVLSLLPEQWRRLLAEGLSLDLVHLNPNELKNHFVSLRAA